MTFDYWGMSEEELFDRAFDKDDEYGRVENLGALAAFFTSKRRFEEAAGMWLACLEACTEEKGQDLELWFQVTSNYASALIDVKRHDEICALAIPAAEEAYAAGHFFAAYNLYMDAAEAQRLSGNQREAIRLQRLSVQAAALTAFAPAHARANHFLASLCITEELFNEALEAAKVAVEKHLELEDFRMLIRSKYYLAMAHLGLHNIIDAEIEIRQAWAVANSQFDPGARNLAAYGRAKVHAAMGSYEDAVTWCEKVGKESNGMSASNTTYLDSRYLNARITAEHIDAEKGKELLAEAEDLYKALNLPIPQPNDKLF